MLELGGVAVPLHWIRAGILEFGEVVGGQLEIRRAEVLFQALHATGAGNRRIQGFWASSQASATWAGVASSATVPSRSTQGLVRPPRLRGEAGDGAADVGAREGRVLVDLAGEEAPAERLTAQKPMPSSPRVGRYSASGSRHHSEYSLCRRGDRLDTGGPDGWSARRLRDRPKE